MQHIFAQLNKYSSTVEDILGFKDWILRKNEKIQNINNLTKIIHWNDNILGTKFNYTLGLVLSVSPCFLSLGNIKTCMQLSFHFSQISWLQKVNPCSQSSPTFPSRGTLNLLSWNKNNFAVSDQYRSRQLNSHSPIHSLCTHACTCVCVCACAHTHQHHHHYHQHSFSIFTNIFSVFKNVKFKINNVDLYSQFFPRCSIMKTKICVVKLNIKHLA